MNKTMSKLVLALVNTALHPMAAECAFKYSRHIAKAEHALCYKTSFKTFQGVDISGTLSLTVKQCY